MVFFSSLYILITMITAMLIRGFKFYGYRYIVSVMVVAAVLFNSCKKQTTFVYPAKPEVFIAQGDNRLIGPAIRFFSDTVYIVTGDIMIESGKTLTIDPGTLVKVNTGAGISILEGATINSKGTATLPIVFTVNRAKGQAGTVNILYNYVWKGLSINGNSNGQSSGELAFTRIEFAGAGGNGSAALRLSEVSHLTNLHDIQVSFSLNNSYDFDGGDCNARDLLSFSCSGIDFNMITGYTGKLQNLLAFRDPELANNDFNLSSVFIGGSLTAPVISNLTVMRPGLQSGLNSASGNYSLGQPNRRGGIVVAEDATFHVINSVVMGLPAVRKPDNSVDTASSRAFYIESFPASASLDSGRSALASSVFYQADTNAFYLKPGSYPVYFANDLQTFLKRPQYKNEIFTSLDSFGFTDPFSYNYYYSTLKLSVKPGSSLLTGADFTRPELNDPFFKPVTYRGALGTDNWTEGWTNFLPLQTDYNN